MANAFVVTRTGPGQYQDVPSVEARLSAWRAPSQETGSNAGPLPDRPKGRGVSMGGDTKESLPECIGEGLKPW